MTCDPAAARPQPAAGKPHCPSLQDGCDSPDVCRADGECHYTKTPLAGRARPQPAAAEVEAVAQEATEDESLQARYKALARCYVAQGDLCRELLAQISALRPDTQTAAADVKTAALDLWAKLDTEIDPPGVLDHEQAVKIIGAWLRDNGSALRPATLADVPNGVRVGLAYFLHMTNSHASGQQDRIEVRSFLARTAAAQEKPDAG